MYNIIIKITPARFFSVDGSGNYLSNLFIRSRRHMIKHGVVTDDLLEEEFEEEFVFI